MKELAAALVRAQKAFGPALKSATNPHFKSKYADLAACVEAVIDSLNANGIALVQRTSQDDTGVTVTTVFVHESGEMMDSGPLHVPAAKNDPQGYGSALTYARRYSLMTACGLAPEDDDGNAASRKREDHADTEQPSDPLLFFSPQHQALIRRTAAAAIEAFNEGKEVGAYEEVTSCAEKIAGKDQPKRNQVSLAFNSIFRPYAGLRASLRKLAEAEHAKNT